MDSSISQNPEVRPLLINFNKYTDGDTNFKDQLITHIIANLIELEESFEIANKQNDLKEFKKTYHKVKATIYMLEDPLLTQTIEEIQEAVDMQRIAQQGVLLFSVCKGIMKSLEMEQRRMK